MDIQRKNKCVTAWCWCLTAIVRCLVVRSFSCKPTAETQLRCKDFVVLLFAVLRRGSRCVSGGFSGKSSSFVLFLLSVCYFSNSGA